MTARARALQGLPDACIAELAARIARTPVHANRVVGFAREETVVSAGTPLEGLYLLLKGTRPPPSYPFPYRAPYCIVGGTLPWARRAPEGSTSLISTG